MNTFKRAILRTVLATALVAIPATTFAQQNWEWIAPDESRLLEPSGLSPFWQTGIARVGQVTGLIEIDGNHVAIGTLSISHSTDGETWDRRLPADSSRPFRGIAH